MPCCLFYGTFVVISIPYVLLQFAPCYLYIAVLQES